MAFTIPPLEIDAPMRLDHRGVAQFCEDGKEAFRPSFELHIEATAPDEWEVTDIYMGIQVLTGENLRRFANHFEETRGADISDHVGENFPEVKEQAEYDAREFLMEDA